MFTMDVPYVPAQETHIVLAQAAAPGSTTPQPDYILNTCKETESTGGSTSAFNTLSPSAMLKNYFRSSGRDIDSAKVHTILLEDALNGKLNDFVSGKSYTYAPEPEYTGNDRAVFLAEFEGKVYKIVVELHVFFTVGENDPSATSCPPPQLIKVNKKPSTGSSGYSQNTRGRTHGVRSIVVALRY